MTGAKLDGIRRWLPSTLDDNLDLLSVLTFEVGRFVYEGIYLLESLHHYCLTLVATVSYFYQEIYCMDWLQHGQGQDRTRTASFAADSLSTILLRSIQSKNIPGMTYKRPAKRNRQRWVMEASCSLQLASKFAVLLDLCRSKESPAACFTNLW